MKKVVIWAGLCAVLVGVAVAQVPVIKMPDYFRVGKTMVAVALDTFHFEDAQVAEVADWQGKETVYVPRPNGTLDERTAYVKAAVLYGQKPFRYNAVFRNGDNTASLVQTLVDTVASPAFSGAGVVRHPEAFPCWTVVVGDLDEIRATPGASDSLLCLPLLDYE